jgi:hypothetical protein
MNFKNSFIILKKNLKHKFKFNSELVIKKI